MKELHLLLLPMKMIVITKIKNFWTKFEKVNIEKIKYSKEEKESGFKRTASIT